MALTNEQIDARLLILYNMRDSGVTSVRHGDTSTQFRSMNELLKAIRLLESQRRSGLGLKRSRVSYVRQSTKGYGCE